MPSEIISNFNDSSGQVRLMWGGNHDRGIRQLPGVKGFIARPAIERFREKCRFEPETGCVLWTGSQCYGRGKTIRYGNFRDGKKIWLAHRWSAKFIHGLEIDNLQVDHCCPMYRAGSEPMLPNTLCVQHVQVLTGQKNRWLQTERRRQFVHLEVGILPYHEVYGEPDIIVPSDAIPFYEEPSWLKAA